MSENFTLSANRYPGPCFYCAKRVARGAGACWPDAGAGRYVVAHSACVAASVAAGKAPQVGSAIRGGGARPAVVADMRAACGLGPAGRTAAATLRELRRAIQRVSVVSTEAEILSALADCRALLAAPLETVQAEGDAVPF